MLVMYPELLLRTTFQLSSNHGTVGSPFEFEGGQIAHELLKRMVVECSGSGSIASLEQACKVICWAVLEKSVGQYWGGKIWLLWWSSPAPASAQRLKSIFQILKDIN